MTIKVAKSAGFCYGVRRITEACENFEEAYTLGPIIHNKRVVDKFRERGIEPVDSVAELLPKPRKPVIIRSHGVPPEVIKELEGAGLEYYDYTCPDVKKVQRAAAEAFENGKSLIIIGDKGHPEVVGINGRANYEAQVFGSLSEAMAHDFASDKKYILVAQTTFGHAEFIEISEYLKTKIDGLEIIQTLCKSTMALYKEAETLSKEASVMIVLGDKNSGNTKKLFNICERNSEYAFFVDNVKEINEKLLNIFSTSDIVIGVTAGASADPAMIKEAVHHMNEFNPNLDLNTEESPEAQAPAQDSFESMIEGQNMTLRTGETVKGKVIKVTNGEVFVDLGYKSDGIIQKGQYSDNPDADPAKDLSPGDEIEVYVARVNDGEGNVLLSKKHAEGRKNMLDLEQAFKDGTPLPGKIVEIIKGGCIALIKGVRTFVPSSQVAQRYVPDLSELKDKEFNFKILEFDKKAKRIIAGRKELAALEAQETKDKAFASLKEGDVVKGTVSRITKFGAFVDLGGIDGLIHITELSWSRIRRVTDAVKEGDEVTCVIVGLDPDKGKISLSLRDAQSNPWENIEERYPIGAIVDGRVARIASFGAFIELEEGIDGLVHISQVAGRHIEKVEEELKIGQEIKVKVMAIDLDLKRISLSKKIADNEVYFDYLDDEDYDEYDDGDYADEDYADEEYDEALETEALETEALETEVEAEALGADAEALEVETEADGAPEDEAEAAAEDEVQAESSVEE